MIEHVKNFIRTNNLISSDTNHVFVAVSGGIDSRVLLELLNQMKESLEYELHILHYNHRTRGRESDSDQQFVEKLAKSYGLDIRISALSSFSQTVSETTLRESRYKFFNKILSENPDSVLATGHNREDNIETFFMRLAKGSRLRGLLAIKPKRNKFIRPLLTVSRAEIQAFARTNKLDYREDKSNEDLSISRNHIRHTILPFLRTNLNEHLDDNLEKTIEDLALYFSLYEKKLEEALISSTVRSRQGISLNRKRYQYFNPVIRRGLIEYCISNVYQLNYTVSDRNFQMWDEFILSAQPGKEFTFLENGSARVERNQILFGEFPTLQKKTFRLHLGDQIKINKRFLIALERIKSEEVNFETDRNVEIIDGEKSGDKLFIRYWKKGDRFKPLGMGHNRKLSDFFIDLKLEKSTKSQIPIVCNKKNIIWIAGYRLADDFKISQKTKLYYKLRLDPINEYN